MLPSGERIDDKGDNEEKSDDGRITPWRDEWSCRWAGIAIVISQPSMPVSPSPQSSIPASPQSPIIAAIIAEHHPESCIILSSIIIWLRKVFHGNEHFQIILSSQFSRSAGYRHIVSIMRQNATALKHLSAPLGIFHQKIWYHHVTSCVNRRSSKMFHVYFQDVLMLMAWLIDGDAIIGFSVMAILVMPWLPWLPWAPSSADAPAHHRRKSLCGIAAHLIGITQWRRRRHRRRHATPRAAPRCHGIIRRRGAPRVRKR